MPCCLDSAHLGIFSFEMCSIYYKPALVPCFFVTFVCCILYTNIWAFYHMSCEWASSNLGEEFDEISLNIAEELYIVLYVFYCGDYNLFENGWEKTLKGRYETAKWHVQIRHPLLPRKQNQNKPKTRFSDSWTGRSAQANPAEDGDMIDQHVNEGSVVYRVQSSLIYTTGFCTSQKHFLMVQRLGAVVWRPLTWVDLW